MQGPLSNARLHQLLRQLPNEVHVLARKTGAQRGAWTGRFYGVEHALDSPAATPFVDLHLKCSVHHASAGHEGVDSVAMKHNRIDRRSSVGKRAGKVVLPRTDCATIGKANVACQVARRQVFLAERSETIELFNVFDCELREIDQRVDLDERMEAVLGELVHIRAQSLREFRKLVGRKGYPDRSSVTPEAREDVGCGFDGLE